MLSDNNIRDLFNNPKTDGEDWLIPSDYVFLNIEDSIYSKKKKRSFFWIWFLGLSLLLLSVAIFFYSSKINSSAHHGTSDLKTEQHTSDIAINEKPEKELQEELTISSTLEKKSTEQVVIEKAPAEKTKTSLLKNSASKNIRATEIKNKSNTAISLQSSQNRSTASLDNSNLKVANRKNVASPVKLERVIIDTKILSIATLSNIGSIPSLLSRSATKIDINQNNSPIKISTPKSVSWSIGTGYTLWDFKLNENYKSALINADFNHDLGKGYAIYGGLEKILGHRTTLNAALSYERVKINSGHNSNIIYGSTEEEETYDLTMASPLGFLSSSVLIQRTSQGTEPNDNLVLDLDNQHSLSNLDLGLALSHTLIDLSKITLDINSGLGVSKIFGLENQLSKVGIDNTNYNTLNTSITQDQQDLNLFRPYYTIGLQSNVLISEDMQASIGYSLKRDFNSTFKSGDFNSILTRHQLYLQLSRRF